MGLNETEVRPEGMSEDSIVFWQILGTVFGAIMLESLLYGVHLVLFCVCFYILITRRNPAHLVILLSITVMFILATADVALTYQFALLRLPAVLKQEIDISSVLRHLSLKYMLFVANNLIADGLLLYRCFMVWGGRKYYIILAPALLLVADTVWGFLSLSIPVYSLAITFTPVFFWSLFVFNVIMTMATAGRIWWKGRAAQLVLGKQQIQRYHTAIAIIIQSGAIYSLSVLLYVVAHENDKSYYFIFLATTLRIVGIMPTLMIVQVELGRNIHQTDVYSVAPTRIDSRSVSSVDTSAGPAILGSTD